MVDDAGFSASRVCPIKHTFHRHPLMQMEALAALARRLMPTEQCRFIRPGVRQDSAFDHAAASHDGRGIDEVFARIEEPGSWVALYNVQTDAAYRGFVDEVAACVRPLVEREQPGMFEVGGFIFISAPPSVTPFHIDRENNFWLQVRGRKLMSVWDPGNRAAVPLPAVEDFVVHGGQAGVALREDVRALAHNFDVGPGDGVYFPMTSPHMTRSDPGWVTAGDGVSVSIGVVFYTEATRRAAYGHAFNRMARRIGLAPSAPQGALGAEAWRYFAGRAVVGLHRRLRGWTPPRGF